MTTKRMDGIDSIDRPSLAGLQVVVAGLGATGQAAARTTSATLASSSAATRVPLRGNPATSSRKAPFTWSRSR